MTLLWTPSRADLYLVIDITRQYTLNHTEFSLYGLEHRLKRLVVWLKVIEFACSLWAVLINVSTQSEPSLITLCTGQRHEGRMQSRMLRKFHPVKARGEKKSLDLTECVITFPSISHQPTDTRTVYFCCTLPSPAHPPQLPFQISS